MAPTGARSPQGIGAAPRRLERPAGRALCGPHAREPPPALTRTGGPAAEPSRRPPPDPMSRAPGKERGPITDEARNQEIQSRLSKLGRAADGPLSLRGALDQAAEAELEERLRHERQRILQHVESTLAARERELGERERVIAEQERSA